MIMYKIILRKPGALFSGEKSDLKEYLRLISDFEKLFKFVLPDKLPPQCRYDKRQEQSPSLPSFDRLAVF